MPNTGWRDITRPLWQAMQSDRLTQLGRLERIHSNAIRQYLGTIPVSQTWLKSCKKGAKKSCDIYEKRMKMLKKEGELKLVKIASSFCNEVETEQVAIRIRSDEALKWSERHTAVKEHVDYDVGVFPLDKNVISAGIYR